MIRAIAFDFDGTLVPSHRLKRRAFYDVTSDLPGAASVLDRLLSAPVPPDRIEAFRLLISDLKARGLRNLPESDALTARYGAHTETRILALLAASPAGALLEDFRADGMRLFLVTRTPGPAIEAILEKANFRRHFDDVIGAPASKIDGLRSVLRQTKLPANEVLMVGDEESDRLAAAAVGTAFVAIASGEGNFSRPPEWRIEFVAELPAMLRRLHGGDGVGDGRALAG